MEELSPQFTSSPNATPSPKPLTLIANTSSPFLTPKPPHQWTASNLSTEFRPWRTQSGPTKFIQVDAAPTSNLIQALGHGTSPPDLNKITNDVAEIRISARNLEGTNTGTSLNTNDTVKELKQLNSTTSDIRSYTESLLTEVKQINVSIPSLPTDITPVLDRMDDMQTGIDDLISKLHQFHVILTDLHSINQSYGAVARGMTILVGHQDSGAIANCLDWVTLTYPDPSGNGNITTPAMYLEFTNTDNPPFTHILAPTSSRLAFDSTTNQVVSANYQLWDGVVP